METHRISATREHRVEKALFRGASLTLDNPRYRHAVSAVVELLLRDDLATRDLTVEALEIEDRCSSAIVVAREGGIAAGLAELALMLEAYKIDVIFEKHDGDAIRSGDTLLRAEGHRTQLLALERVGLNLVQRMSGIATAANRLQERLRAHAFATRVVGTRKTPWGLLDKRALHVGNGGTHRLGLGDAIVIKNNHLALIASREEEAASAAIEKAWQSREGAAFIEVEVRSEKAARAATRAFRRLQQEASEDYPCLLMLDNMQPSGVAAILHALKRENLWDCALTEASGGISESNLEQYAATGVDAISIGALTHSVRALDISQQIS